MSQSSFSFAGPAFERYRLIYADPPWKHNNYGQAKHGAAKAHYPEMSVEQLGAMPVRDVAHDAGAVLAMWCTGAQGADGAHCQLTEAWGFSCRTSLMTWVKCQRACSNCEHPWEEHQAWPEDHRLFWDPPGPCGCGCTHFGVRLYHGPGSYTGNGTETLWLATGGEGWSRDRARMDVREDVIHPLPCYPGTNKPKHAAKPAVFRRRLEILWPHATPRLEMFARKAVPGWDVFGDQVEGGVDLFREFLPRVEVAHEVESSVDLFGEVRS